MINELGLNVFVSLSMLLKHIFRLFSPMLFLLPSFLTLDGQVEQDLQMPLLFLFKESLE